MQLHSIFQTQLHLYTVYKILKFDNPLGLCYAIMGSAATWKYTVYKICSCHSNAAACQILAGRSCMEILKFDSCPAGCSCLAADLVAAAWGAAPGCQILERAEFWALGKFWKVKNGGQKNLTFQKILTIRPGVIIGIF